MEAAVRAPAKTQALARPLRVLFVAPQASGGLAQHVLGLLKHLDRNRFQPLLACPGKGSVAEAASALGVEVCPLPIGSGSLRCFRLSWSLAGCAARQRADLLHAHGFQAGLTAAWARQFATSSRLLCTVHGYPPSGGWRARQALRTIAARADRVIAVSEALSRAFSNIARTPLPVVATPNGIDLDAKVNPCDLRAELALPSDVKLVGMVARLAPQKGIGVFIEAASLAINRLNDLRFVLVGDGPLRAEAEAQVRSLGLAGRVHFLGQREGTRGLIRCLDLLVIASTSEGSSMAAMEAMAEGKPVVATAVGGVPEVVTDGVTGCLVPPKDPSALAEAILAVLSDPEKAAQLGAAGRARAWNEFNLKQMVDRTQSLYEEVLARG